MRPVQINCLAKFICCLIKEDLRIKENKKKKLCSIILVGNFAKVITVANEVITENLVIGR